MSDKKHIEPYQPDYSAVVPAEPQKSKPPSPQRGCAERILIYLLVFVAFLGVMIPVLFLIGVDTVGDSTSNMIDSLADLFDGSNEVNVNVRQILGTIQQQAWLETARQNQQLDLNAEDNVQIGGIVSVPVTRGVKFDAVVTVTAGINLQLLEETDFVVDGDTLTLILPAPQIKDCILLEDLSSFDRNTYCSTVGTCRDLEETLRQTALETAATQGIDEIRVEAFNNADQVIRDLVVQSGFTGTLQIERSTELMPPVAEGGSCPGMSVLLPTPTPTTTP